MPSRPLDKLLAAVGLRPKAGMLVVVQTERGQTVVSADALRKHLRRR
jgi:hypothetical protein